MSDKDIIKQKIIKTGNSASVTIPHKFVESLNLRIGDKVESTMDYYGGTITYSFPTKRQLMFSKTNLH